MVPLICRIHFYHLCTVPLICYDRLQRALIEGKRISSSFQTRMHCTCVSETSGNIIFYLRINLCVRVSDLQKYSKKMRENSICRHQRFSGTHACKFRHARATHVCLTGGCNQFYFDGCPLQMFVAN